MLILYFLEGEFLLLSMFTKNFNRKVNNNGTMVDSDFYIVIGIHTMLLNIIEFIRANKKAKICFLNISLI